MLPGSLDKARVQFAQAKPMLEIYRQIFGDYPFEKDGYKLIEVPYSGMEHQSAVTYGNRFANGYLERDWTGVGVSLKFDFIIIHESAHEWFGNAVSAADVSDMWIQEGWTTYLEALYVEKLLRLRRCGQVCERLQVQGGEQRADHHAARHPPVAAAGSVLQGGFVPAHTCEAWSRTLGGGRQARRPEWYTLLRDVYQQFKYKNIMTEDMVAFINQQANHDLTPIFDQYLRRAALPTLQLAFNEQDATVAYRWEAEERAFAMPIRVGRPEAWQTIWPTTNWQVMPNATPKESFDVATDLYYVNVTKQ